MRILSGIQPTGQFHLGNYLGALKHWLKFQDRDNECFYTIVDLHALTTVHDARTLRQNIRESKIAMLSIGLNPEKSTLFAQSQVHAHTQLGWIFTTLTPLGELERMTQYKEKAKQALKNNGVNAGLLTYPTLMAADILLYNPDYVPVGEDQKQHLELARNIAEKFNKTYGQVFKIPNTMIYKETARIMSLQDPAKKMSKSLGPQHYIGLFEDESSIRDKIKKAVTDSEKEIKYDPKNKPAISNLLAIYSGVTDKPIKDLEKELEGKSYADLKSSLADAVVAHIAPIQQKYAEFTANFSFVERAFETGAEKARTETEKVMELVTQKVGLE